MIKILKIGETFGTPLRVRKVSGFIFQDVSFNSAQLPRHAHEDAHISLLLEGHYAQFSNSEIFEYKPTMLSFHPPGETHSNEIPAMGTRELVLWPTPENFNRLFGKMSILGSSKQFVVGRAIKTAIRLYREFCNNDKVSNFALEALALELLVSAEREIEKERHSGCPSWLSRVREYLHDNYLNDLSMKDLAIISGVHQTHLARSFHRYFGCSLGEYVRRLRIEAARKELARGLNSISNVALNYGFYDQSHFTKVFKTYFGFTPSAYRRQTFKG